MRKFRWEAWIDPLNKNLSEIEWPGFDDVAPIDTDADIEHYDFSGDKNIAVDSAESYIDFEKLGMGYHAIKPIRVISTRLGLLTVTEGTVANYHFDFWTLHSDQPFTEKDAEIICEVPGIETFSALTRYRCRLGFPKSGLFDITQVKLAVEKALREADEPEIINADNDFPDEIEDVITKKTSELNKKGGHWLLYVLPNGNMEIFESDIKGRVYNTKLKLFEETKKLAGGKVFKS